MLASACWLQILNRAREEAMLLAGSPIPFARPKSLRTRGLRKCL
jgi:hypothetical protein